MLAILAAAAIGAAPAAIETPNVYRAPSRCGDVHRQVVERQREQLQPLGRLPRAGGMYAVMRTVNGCQVPTPMGYHPDYLMPGAVDAPEFRPSDGRSNRR